MKNLLAVAIALALATSCSMVKQPAATEQPIVFDDVATKEGGANFPGEKFYWQYPDQDLDGFGNSTRADSVLKKKAQVGYAAKKGDCNDYNRDIYPGTTEVKNDVDDNCDGQVDEGLILPGITITRSDVLQPEYFSGDASDMFIKNSATDSEFVNTIKSGNFNSMIVWNGHFSRWAHPQSQVPGKKGDGYNPKQPPVCGIMYNEFCTPYGRDFFAEWDTLVRQINAKAIYTVNVMEGTLSEVYYVIDRFKEQNKMMLLMGLEGPSEKVPASENHPLLNAAQYAKRFYEWKDSISKQYPKKEFIFVADIPDLNADSKWTLEFIKYRTPDSTVFIRQYYHMAYRVNLNGDAAHDSAEYSYGVTYGLPQHAGWVEKYFPTIGGWMLIQTSVGDSLYNGGKIAGRFVDVAQYFRMYKYWEDLTRNGEANVLGSNFIGTKLMLKALDFAWVSMINRKYVKQRYSCEVVHTLGPQVDIGAGYLNGVYSLFIQNRSGKEVALPEYLQVDGRLVKLKDMIVFNIEGKACNELGSKEYALYNPFTKGILAPFSGVYFDAQ